MSVEEWIAKKARGWHADVVRRLVAIGQRAAPSATLAIKWGQPVFADSGPVAFIKVAKAHVTFGFWRGVELGHGAGVLEGGARMKHLKIHASDALDEKLITALLKEAVALNRTRGDPTR